MKHLILSWLVVLFGALALGPIVASLVEGLRASDGGPDVTMLFNTSPAIGVIGVLVGVFLAAGLGAATARALSVRMGLFAAGTVLAWQAWQLGAVAGLLRSARSAAPLWTMVVEGALMIVFGVVIAAVVVRCAGKEDPDRDVASVSGEQSLRGAAAVIVVGGLLAWIVAREGLKGQTIAAAGVAAIGGVTVARLTAPRAHPVALIAGLLALAMVSPAIGALLSGGSVLEAMYAGSLFPLALISPLDWVAGALLGTPIGLAWSASMIEKRVEQAA